MRHGWREHGLFVTGALGVLVATLASEPQRQAERFGVVAPGALFAANAMGRTYRNSVQQMTNVRSLAEPAHAAASCLKQG